jgi:hypothetical protein
VPTAVAAELYHVNAGTALCCLECSPCKQHCLADARKQVTCCHSWPPSLRCLKRISLLRRHDKPVTQSNGEVRPGTEGARTRAMFKKLPGVGNRMALHWWQKGLRCTAAPAALHCGALPRKTAVNNHETVCCGCLWSCPATAQVQQPSAQYCLCWIIWKVCSAGRSRM